MANTEDKLKKQKVAIYIRVSTQYQVDKDSLQVQRRELTAYSEMILGINDYVVFEDPGYSAKNTDRPDYQRMMSRLRTGEFSHLLVWKIDRISRNLLNFSQMYQELKSLGIVFVSKNEQFDTSNAIGEAMLKIILVFAELERNMTSERVTAVMMSRANNGQWNGGRVAFGYQYDKETDTFSFVPNEAKIVNLIYDLYEQYQSVLYVSRYLNDANITSRSGKSWSSATVYGILTNPFYKGSYKYNVRSCGKGVVKNDESEWIIVPEHHEPMISEDRFDRIQFILKRNKRGGVPEEKTYIRKNIHIFAGLVHCFNCGGAMTATLDRRRANGWRPSIYGCATRRNDNARCDNKYLSDKVVGPFVFNYVANIIRAKGSLGKRSTPDVLERKLLRGEAFNEIAHIEPEGLNAMHELIVSGVMGLEYKPNILSDTKADMSERTFLKDRRRKCENAMNRLKALYLYGDEELPEKDYIIERKKILDDLAQIDEQLAMLQENDIDEGITDEFIEKASYFVMVEKLLDGRYVDYEKYIRNIEQGVARNFIKSIITDITAWDGKIISIKFKNGIEHKFVYKDGTFETPLPNK